MTRNGAFLAGCLAVTTCLGACGKSSSSSTSLGPIASIVVAVTNAQTATMAAAACEGWSPGTVAFFQGSGAAMGALFQSEVDTGKMTYSQANGDACLAATQALTCAELRAGASPASCDAAFTGTVAVGGACTNDEVCANGYCGGTTCPGVCAAKKANTIACGSPSQCTSGACPAGTCVAKVAPGATGANCGTGPECVAGNYCDGGTGKCAALKVATAACSDSAECVAGLGCDATGVCAVPKGVGATCAGHADCAFITYCSVAAGNKCTELPSAVGHDCTEIGACLSIDGSLDCSATTHKCVSSTANACWML